jgi:hypothetical protein
MPGVVTVACKIPNGLILRLYEMVDTQEPVSGGGTRTVKVARQKGERIDIKGPAAPVGQLPKAQVHAGYALTPGVDADFFAAWLQQNAGHPAVMNRLLFASEKLDTVSKVADEYKTVKSGLEPLNVDGGDLRVPGKIKKAEKE